MQPLAQADQTSAATATRLSTSISLSLINENGTNIPFQINNNQSIELFIPKDPHAYLSLMEWQKKQSQNGTDRFFHMHFMNLRRDDDLTVAVHFEIRPDDRLTAYWLIFRFDQPPSVYPSSSPVLDGWTLLCPSSNTFLQLISNLSFSSSSSRSHQRWYLSIFHRQSESLRSPFDHLRSSTTQIDRAIRILRFQRSSHSTTKHLRFHHEFY